MLTHRLRKLVDEEVLERRRYQDRPERFEYHPTDKGRALRSVMVTLMHWGDEYYSGPDGPPRLLRHRGCGGQLAESFTCGRCGASLRFDDVDSSLNAARVLDRSVRDHLPTYPGADNSVALCPRHDDGGVARCRAGVAPVSRRRTRVM